MNYAHPRAAILVLAKAPQPGAVKTRLVPTLTPEQAAALHAELVRRTLRMATTTPLAPVTLYGAPDTRAAFFRQCRQDFPITLADQVGADLGERMDQALTAALRQAGYALLIGTDCPDMDAAYLSVALQALAEGSEVVLGPAADGGYVLIGLRRPQPGLFTDIEWGSAGVAAATRQRAGQWGLPVFELPTRADLDTPADLAAFLAREPSAL